MPSIRVWRKTVHINLSTPNCCRFVFVRHPISHGKEASYTPTAVTTILPERRLAGCKESIVVVAVAALTIPAREKGR